MTHIHWVARQNKLEIPRDKDHDSEVNKWEIQEWDGRVHDPDTMLAPPTPKTDPTPKTETLVRKTPTITSCREENVDLRKWPSSRYCCVRLSHSWNWNKNRKFRRENPGPTYQPKYQWDTHHTQITLSPTHHTNAMDERPTQSRRPSTDPVCVRRVNLLVCSLPLHRHSYIGFIFSFRFIDSQ